MFTILGTDGKEYGPVTAGHILEWIREGRLNLQTKAKLDRENVWKTLGEFAEFGGRPLAVPAAPPIMAASLAPGRPMVVEVAEANRWLRLPAAVIDGILKGLCYLPITIPLVRTIMAEALAGKQRTFLEISEITNQIVSQNVLHALPLFGLLVLLQLWLLSWRGQSVGKLLLGLRIVRVPDNAAPGFMRAFLLRGTLPFMLEQVPVLGLVFWAVDSCFIFRADQRCLHDLVAGTKVVKT